MWAPRAYANQRWRPGITVLTQAWAPDLQTVSRIAAVMSCCTTYHHLLKEYQAVMTMQTHLSPLVALIVGILILIFPRFLNYFITIYLIVTGLIGLGALRSIGSP